MRFRSRRDDLADRLHHLLRGCDGSWRIAREAGIDAPEMFVEDLRVAQSLVVGDAQRSRGHLGARRAASLKDWASG